MVNRYPDSVRSKAIELYELGVTGRQIADRMNIDQTTITRWARSAGVVRQRGPRIRTRFCDGCGATLRELAGCDCWGTT